MLKLALLNLFRYRKRTIITAFAIAIGITLGIFVQALLSGVNKESNRNLIWYETSSAKIYEKQWFEERKFYPIDYIIEKDKALSLEKALEKRGITNYTKEFVEDAEVIFYEDPYPSTGSITTILHALDNSTPPVYKFDKAELEGEWIKPNSEGVVIGEKLARDIQAEIGYYLTIQCKGKGGFLQAFDVPIIGIINTGNPVADGSTLYFDYSFINEILELDGSYSSFAFLPEGSINKMLRTTKKLMPVLREAAIEADLEAHDWTEIAKELMDLSNGDKGSSLIIIFFLFIIAIVGVSNTMVMAITERKNEIAMLRAIGYNSNYIISLFTLEGGLLGVLGSILGSIFGVITSIYVQINGFDFSSIGEDIDMGYRINTVMYANLSYIDVLGICFIAIFFSLLSAFFAVRRSTKGEIAAQLRKI